MRADDMRRVLGFSWAGWLNLLVLQWLFVRIAYRVEGAGDTITGWGVKFAVPMTGWFGIPLVPNWRAHIWPARSAPTTD